MANADAYVMHQELSPPRPYSLLLSHGLPRVERVIISTPWARSVIDNDAVSGPKAQQVGHGAEAQLWLLCSDQGWKHDLLPVWN